MPKLKPGTIWPTPEEEAAIQAGIAADPDNPELDAEWFADAKPTHEIYPNGIDKPPYIPKEWRERLAPGVPRILEEQRNAHRWN